jgi:hypothetical protein
MKIKIDENNCIQSFSMTGSLNDGVEIEQSQIPNDFETNFTPNFFKFEDGKIIVNNSFKKPKNITISSLEMQAINALGMQVAQIQAKLTTTNGGAS